MTPEPQASARILVVDDDVKTADLVALYLRHAGHRVRVEHSGTDARAAIRSDDFDLLVLDVMLPGPSGLEVCAEVRRDSNVPIILLTARTLEDQRIEGLDGGADDYVTKPFQPRELVARVHAVLRRAPPGDGKVLRAGPLEIHVEQRRVRAGGADVSLTPTEFELLRALAERPGRVLSRRQLLERLPDGGRDVLDRTVDVHVRNLRRKLGSAAGGADDAIETVFGVGYRMRA